MSPVGDAHPRGTHLAARRLSVALFCGSNAGVDPKYAALARETSRYLAARGHTIVYGGSRAGLMGTVADAALDVDGTVVGVIPRSLVELELAHPRVRRLEIVSSMHERKARMAALADAFVALPGGIGTLEELFEMWTWNQLGLHTKPVAIVDRFGFFDPLMTFADRLVEEGFLKHAHRRALIAASSPASLEAKLLAYRYERDDKLYPSAI